MLKNSAARAIKHLRVSPLAVMESNDKNRVILDLSFGAGGDGDGWTGGNGDTCFETAPVSIGGVLPSILRHACALRETKGGGVPIYRSKKDVADAFRRIHIECEKAPVFSYVVDECLMVDFRMAFGRRNSPGWWSLVESAMVHSHRHTNIFNVQVLPEAEEIALNMRVLASPLGEPPACAPPGVAVEPFASEFTPGIFFGEMSVDE